MIPSHGRWTAMVEDTWKITNINNTANILAQESWNTALAVKTNSGRKRVKLILPLTKPQRLA